MTDKPRILIFTGDGKGKTTAAMGMVLRASSHGLRVKVVQFLKSDTGSGEIAALQSLPGVDFVRRGLGFVPKRRNDPQVAEHRRIAEEGLDLAREAILSGDYDLVVLDEICGAIATGLLEEAAVIALLNQAPAELRLVLTGRHATSALMELADTVTEMRCIKHALQQGITAQKGVEF
ncbi:MAG: cob(I)yrinic acid a,c-diamide adenosyltransferase [Desulfuromonadaceae bacterium]